MVHHENFLTKTFVFQYLKNGTYLFPVFIWWSKLLKKKNSNYPHKNHQINKKHSESITTPQTSSTPSSEADPHATPKRATKSNRRRTHTPMPRTRGPWPRSSLLSNPWLGHGGWVWYPPAAWGGRYLLVDGRMHSSALGSSASRRTTSRNVLTPYWWAVPYLAR